MPSLIDTDWTIDRLNGDGAAISLLNELANDGIAISIVTYMEAYQGVLRSERPDRAEHQFHALLDGIPVLPLSRGVARRCARLRHELKSAGKRVNQRALDLIIAATAIEFELTLVTRNVADYADIEGLTIDSAT
ncbi:MAG: type II toxin-antitoxin system VapC family toxin [Chloroflexi bacterium]|nr:type II toxin-antitoxin system VapC family toxin [Chloroflexota bacterium]